jgi:DNA (cytosine-5)-methyltransferase 1
MQTMKTPYAPDILCRTILTAVKPHHYHPSGTRRFSIREYAALQTFPHHFIFMGGPAESLRQIGNAVPPMVGKELFRHITAELRTSDEAEERVAGHPRAGSFQGHAGIFDMAAAGQANDWQF